MGIYITITYIAFLYGSDEQRNLQASVFPGPTHSSSFRCMCFVNSLSLFKIVHFSISQRMGGRKERTGRQWILPRYIASLKQHNPAFWYKSNLAQLEL